MISSIPSLFKSACSRQRAFHPVSKTSGLESLMGLEKSQVLENKKKDDDQMSH